MPGQIRFPKGDVPRVWWEGKKNTGRQWFICAAKSDLCLTEPSPQVQLKDFIAQFW